jgi:hypothetical protein
MASSNSPPLQINIRSSVGDVEQSHPGPSLVQILPSHETQVLVKETHSDSAPPPLATATRYFTAARSFTVFRSFLAFGAFLSNILQIVAFAKSEQQGLFLLYLLLFVTHGLIYSFIDQAFRRNRSVF